MGILGAATFVAHFITNRAAHILTKKSVGVMIVSLLAFGTIVGVGNIGRHQYKVR